MPVHHALDLGDAEAPGGDVSVAIRLTETREEVRPVIVLEDTDFGLEDVDPGIVGVEADSPVHMIIQDPLIPTMFTDFLKSNRVKSLRFFTCELKLFLRACSIM